MRKQDRLKIAIFALVNALQATMIVVFYSEILKWLKFRIPVYQVEEIFAVMLSLCLLCIYIFQTRTAANTYRWFSGNKKLRAADEERIRALLEPLLKTAKEKNIAEIRQYDLKIYGENSMESNAFALGSNILVITYGALDNLTDAELKGILAHELGHLIYDKEYGMMLLGSKVPVILLLFIADILYKLINILLAIPLLPIQILGILSALVMLPLLVVYKISEFIIGVFFNFCSRGHEYRADQMTRQLEVHNEFIQACKRWLPYEKRSWGSDWQYTHPRTLKRIEKLYATYKNKEGSK